MAVFITTSTDAFEEARAKAQGTRTNTHNIRRPLRGIQVKPNTYSTLRVRTATGKTIPLLDSSGYPDDPNADTGRSDNYANFLIQNLRESRAEKQQIIETFGEDYVYFFGERPRFLEVSGMLINTADFNWKAEFWSNYDQHLRGTKLVEQNARLYFYFDDTVVEGYMIAASTVGDSQQPHLMPFQFQLFVTNYAILSNVGSVYFSDSDTGRKAVNRLDPIAPSTTSAMLAGAVQNPGGLTSFLAKTAALANDATFAIQKTIEEIRDTLYARPILVPDGIGGMANSLRTAPPIENKGDFGEAPKGVPIYMMTDEFVERMPDNLVGQARLGALAETTRINTLLAVQNPVALEARARADFAKAGVDTTKPSAMMTILGRGAFAAIQYAAPFGLAKVGGGKIGIGDQAIGQIL